MSRCPRCGAGRMFAPGLKGCLGALNPTCPVCGLRFLREAGYFLGAMYISYGLGVVTVLPVAIVLAVVMTISTLQTLLSLPLFLRFSRVLWLHVDFAFDPT